MLNPKYARVAERLRQLIAEGKALQLGPLSLPFNDIEFTAWSVKVQSILQNSFGSGSVYFHNLQNRSLYEHPTNVIVGTLMGALSDLEDGFLANQENLVAGVVFDSVLEQAKHLVEKGFKDPAAILCRVVLEDTLKRICRNAGLPDAGMASALNDALKKSDRFNQPLWGLVQAWIHLGNAAAHGRFEEYDEAQVKRLIEDIAAFAARELGS